MSPTRLVRSERAAAVLLLIAAAAGIIAANSPLAPALFDLQHLHLGFPIESIDLSLGHWVSDGLLAIFFFVVAVELKHELVAGHLDTVSKAIRPAIAAIGGVLVPVVIYLAMTAGSGYEGGWPVPTATDIAFALGVLALFGKGMPGRLRVFLLAVAILDDIVAIVIIAVFFTTDPDLVAIGLALVCVVAFGALSRLLHTRARIVIAIAMVVLAILTWGLVVSSGVHATIAGVLLGLAMARGPGASARHALEPISNGVVLPLFAFSAALVAFPTATISQLSAPFWAILIALPLGKVIGISVGGWLSTFVGSRDARPPLSILGFITAGALGGIGFTVSLLMNDLAFAGDETVLGEGTLAVLLGSSVSIVASAVLVSRQAAYYRRLRTLRLAAEQRA
jgi:Na+:H+ antiporter, NhaA family